MDNTIAVLEEPGKMVIKPAAIPDPKDDEVLIKVSQVGMCGSDIHGFQFGPYLPPEDPNQVIGLGHEIAGIIEKVGKNVTDLKIGDRVCVEPGVPCYKCEFCLSGHYNVCPDVDFMATAPNYKGALTNYLTHPANLTFKLPDNMSLVEGALVEPAAVGIHAAEMGGNLVGKTIVILGSGAIGLMTTMAAKLSGASKIVVIDVLKNRLNKAIELGATAALDGRDEDIIDKVKSIVGTYGADLVYETAGAIATAKMGLQLVKRTGKFLIVGTIPGETPIDFLKINREVTIQTIFRYVNDYQKTIDMISNHTLDVLAITDKYFDYQDTQKAFEFAVNNKSEFIKGVITVDGTLK